MFQKRPTARTIPLAVALAATLATFAAQAQTDDAGRGRSRTAAGPFGLPAFGNVITLAGLEAVQDELGLTPDERAKVRTAIDEYSKALIGDMEAAGLGRERSRALLTPEEREAKSREMQAKRAEITARHDAQTRAQFKKLLSADQFRRLQQISWQVAPVEALCDDPEVAEALQLSERQRQSILAINDDFLGERLATALRPRNEAPADLETSAEKRAQLEKKRDEDLSNVLNPEQQAKFAVLKGKPVDLAAVIGPKGYGGLGRRGLRDEGPAARDRADRAGARGRSGLGEIGIPGAGKIVRLVGLEAVYNDLDLEAPQVAQVRKLLDDYRESRDREREEAGVGPSAMAELRSLGGEERRARLREISTKQSEIDGKAEARFREQLKELITADQFGRLLQISWQVAPIEALAGDPDLAKALGMSQEQQDAIARLNDDFREKQRELLGRSRAPRGTQPGATIDERLVPVAERSFQLTVDREDRVADVLGKELQAKFMSLKGRPVDMGELMGPLGFGGARGRARAGDVPRGGRPKTAPPETTE